MAAIKITEENQKHLNRSPGFLSLLLDLEAKIFNSKKHTAVDLFYFLPLKWFSADSINK